MEMAYPGRREVDVALRDGSTVHVRPVRATDAPAVRAFFERLSPESTGLRFFSGFPNLDSAVGWATEVDDQRRYSLVATSGDGRVLAHAGWERELDRPERAEVALAIADAMQGKGLGTILLGQLAEAADQAGIGTLGAEVLPHNHNMIKVFRDSGFPVKTHAVPGVVGFPSNPPSLGQSARDKPINFVIQTSSTYDELQKMVDAMLEKVRDYPGLIDVDSDLKLNSPQLDISVDREKAAATAVEIDTLGRTLETMLGGRQVTRFKQNGEQYDVVVKIADIDRQNPDDMRRIYVKGREGAMIPLSNLIAIKETVAPKELNHFNQLRAATITAQLAPGYTLSDGLSFLAKTAQEVLPITAHVEYSGQSREFM